MDTAELNWRKICNAVRQGQREIANPRGLESVIDCLQQLIPKCGPASQTAQMCQRIGKIMSNENYSVLAPCCPDYAHCDSRYIFGGLSGNVSLLAQKHISFLKEIRHLLPGANFVLLYADQESEDEALLQSTKTTREEFRGLVRKSVEQTRTEVAEFGWQVRMMTEEIPDITLEEKEVSDWIRNNLKFKIRINTETIYRAEMYWKIALSAGKRFSAEEMTERTIRTAAQYVAVGRFASSKKSLVSNHTTVNLSWYLQTEAAVLHNPVDVY